MTKKTAHCIVPMAGLMAIVYSVCFTGTDVLPKISFTIFCCLAMVVLWFVLKKLEYLKNKRAVVWYVPIFIISIFNGVFDSNLLDYGNVVAVHLLFAVFILSAMEETGQGRPTDIWNLFFAEKIVNVIMGNWVLFIEAAQVCFHKENAKTKNKETPKAKNEKITKIFIGLALSIPFMVIILFLLVSADQVFQSLFWSFLDLFRIKENYDISIFAHVLPVAIVFIYASGYIHHASGQSKKTHGTAVSLLKVDETIGATFLILINALFLVFTIVQVAFLFTGGFMKLPGELVYSEYAREGFFQLLFVTVINFMVLLFFIIIAQGAKESRLLKTLLIMLCVFTGVLIASSFYRMNLYIQSYGYTTLRLQVITFLAMEVFLIGITVAYFLFPKIPLVKYFILIGLLFYMGVNITGSHYFAAKMNIYRFWQDSNAVIDLTEADEDSLSLIHDLYTSREYADGEILQIGMTIYHREKGETLKRESLDAAKDIFNMSDLNHWQNWSLLEHISRQKLFK